MGKKVKEGLDDSLEGQIEAARRIVANGGCLGDGFIWCPASPPCPDGCLYYSCPARGMSEAAKKAMGWDCCESAASAKAFLARHASPVTPDRETIQGPRFDTTREKSKEGKE